MIAFTQYFNQCFNVRLKGYTHCPWETLTVERKEIPGGIFRLTKWKCKELVFYTFGIFYHEPSKRPGHGGEWSSSESSVKEIFGIELLEVSLNGRGVSMEYPEIFKLLNPDVYQKNIVDTYVSGLHSNFIVDPKMFASYDAQGIQII